MYHGQGRPVAFNNHHKKNKDVDLEESSLSDEDEVIITEEDDSFKDSHDE